MHAGGERLFQLRHALDVRVPHCKRVGARQFLKEVRQELNKVDWPTRKELGTYTVVVVGAGMAPVVQKSVTVTDGKDLPLDFTLTEAQPFSIVKSAGGTPIPLTDDFNSASFADAPEIDLNQAWQLQNDLNG